MISPFLLKIVEKRGSNKMDNLDEKYPFYIEIRESSLGRWIKLLALGVVVLASYFAGVNSTGTNAKY
jgi:hypothetical protein